MSLKTKAVLIFLVILVLYGAADYAVQHIVVLPGFIALEQNEAQTDLDRAVETIKSNIRHLNTLCWDWSAWDDTYAYMASRSNEYIKSNLPVSTFTDSTLNLIYFIDQDGQIVWGKIYNLKTEKPMALAGFQRGAFQGGYPLIPQGKQAGKLSQVSVSGVITTQEGPMLVAARPILTSEGLGPRRGTLIIGRLLDDDLLKTFVDQSKVMFSIHPPVRDSSLKPAAGAHHNSTSGNAYWFEKQDPSHLLVSTTFPDIYGNPAFLITADIPRTISVKGYDTSRYAAISGFVSMLLVLIIMLIVLQRTILKPIVKLKDHVLSIEETGDLSARVSSRRRDEIGALGTEFDRMMEKLEERTGKLTAVNREMKIDISRRIQAEAALRESEEKYRSILENIQEGYFEIDIDGNFTFFNGSLCRILGSTEDKLMGRHFRDFTDQETYKKGDASFDRVYTTGKPDKGFGWTITKTDDTERSVEVSVSLRKDVAGETAGLRGIVRDISEKKRLEAQLLQAQKMESIGTLAGGVAHDLNNILGGLVSYPELLLLQLPQDSPLRESILTIQKSGEKAAAVVQDLLTLARRGVVTTEVININDVISEYLESPEYENLQSYHLGVHLETRLGENILNILGSPTHLSKTIMNLISNASEAMPEGGTLTVSTENRYVDGPIRGYDHVKEGDYVVLTVSDTGTGISPDDIGKIFEPFYTKKKMGRSGTGLGMAVVWGTVKDHGGYIDVKSAEGKGTTFTLYFPVTRKSIEERSEISLKDYMSKGETILVIDDVEEQRKIASGMLKELGYSVVSVSSGEEAVEYLRSNKVDLLVLDMIMDPGMDGLDTYRKILEMHSEQKAIIASGFSETNRAKKLQHLGAGAYIRKPFLLEKIGIAVKGELEK